MYGRSRLHVKVEPRSTFTFTRVLSHIFKCFKHGRPGFYFVYARINRQQWESNLNAIGVVEGK